MRDNLRTGSHTGLHHRRLRRGRHATRHPSRRGDASAVVAVSDLHLLLREHARAHAGVREIRQAIHGVGQSFDIWVLRHHRDATQAKRNLLGEQHEADQTVVALSVHHALFVLNHETRRRHGAREAAHHLAAQTQLRVRLFAAPPRDTRASVAARVLRRPRRPHLKFSLPVRRALSAKERVTAEPRISARCVHQPDLPFIVILLTRRRLVAFLLTQRTLHPWLLTWCVHGAGSTRAEGAKRSVRAS